jgi:hypothetical protein
LCNLRCTVFFFFILLSVKHPFNYHSSVFSSPSCSAFLLVSPGVGSFTFFCDSAQSFLGGEGSAMSFGFCGTPWKKQQNSLVPAGPVNS